MPTDRELIEIVTVANMAGVKEAKAGFLGMNPALLATGIALAILVKIGKDSIENTKAQETAFLSLAQAVGTTRIGLDDYRNRVEAFITANQAYIKNQYDVIQAAAMLVRAHNSEKDSLRILNDALDLAVIKNEDVSAAALALERALQGNAKALKELGISTEYATIIKNKHLTAEQKHLAILKLIEAKLKDGRKATDDVTQSQNKLTIAWQTFTTNQGPNMTKLLGTVIDDAAELVGWLDLITQFFEKGGANSWGKMFLNWLSGGRIGTTGAGTHGSGAIAGSSGGMGSARTPIQIHIHGGMFMDHGPTIDAMANAIGRRLASTPGS